MPNLTVEISHCDGQIQSDSPEGKYCVKNLYDISRHSPNAGKKTSVPQFAWGEFSQWYSG